VRCRKCNNRKAAMRKTDQVVPYELQEYGWDVYLYRCNKCGHERYGYIKQVVKRSRRSAPAN